jgi:thioredoxin 1
MALEVTDSNLDETLQTEITVLDFWAQWCGPCRMVGPVIEELANDNKDDEGVAIGKVDVDQNPEAAVRFGIRSIPAVIYFRDGQEVDRIMGANPKSVYQDKINSLK